MYFTEYIFLQNEKFRKRLLHTLFSSGVAKQNKELHDDDIIHLIQQLNDERISLRETADQFNHFEEEVKGDYFNATNPSMQTAL